MEKESSDFHLPPTPPGLCFDRNDFLKTNFSPDNFLDDHKDLPLETIRDDLGVYLKVLRLAMIDVINKDYANFLNLSSMLIGFDKTIEEIRTPVEELNTEIMAIKEEIDHDIKELTMLLNKLKSLRLEDQSNKHYNLVVNCLQSLENIIESVNNKTPKDSIFLIDRASIVYNQAYFSISKCEEQITLEQKEKLKLMDEKLTNTINHLLFYYVKHNDEDNLLKIFLSLASLNKVTETEMLLRKQVIAPCLESIISESSMQRNKEGLRGIYNKILGLLDSQLKLLHIVMKHPKLNSPLNGYQFLINCFWSEIENRIEVNLASIFAPGNPKIFYQRYCESMEFLEKLENISQNKKTVKSFRESLEYKSFQKRWNLPVYFQIRFQEIAGNYESMLHEAPKSSTGSDFLLKQTEAFWKATLDCWSDGIFILALGHKFWKLALQFISRYVTWVNDYCNQTPKKNNKEEVISINKELVTMSLNIYVDIQNILEKLPDLQNNIQLKLQLKSPELIEKSLNISKLRFIETNPKLRNNIVKELFNYYLVQLKQVSDIPRLYRKTNRSVPKKPCNYIDYVSSSVTEFKNDFSTKIDKRFLVDIFQELFEMMTDSYYKAVEDVLTSVQKTEESLRRLKQIREKTPQQTDSTSTVSDGDKIRLQLKVDVKAYSVLLQNTDVDVNKIVKLEELHSLVNNATKDIFIK